MKHGVLFALVFADNDAMKTPLISAFALLSLFGTLAAASAQTPLGDTPTPGYDRPSPARLHQHVVYWNDTMDHYDIDMQIAADAVSTDDLVYKNDKVSLKNYEKRHGEAAAAK